MIAKTVSTYAGISHQDAEFFLNASPDAIFNDDLYNDLINSLDRSLLQDSMSVARDAYEKYLDEFSAELENKYRLGKTAMSPFTLANWLAGFLQTPHMLPTLLDKHARLPTEAMREGLPHILQMLNDIEDPEVRAAWQSALTIVALPLLASG